MDVPQLEKPVGRDSGCLPVVPHFFQQGQSTIGKPIVCRIGLHVHLNTVCAVTRLQLSEKFVISCVTRLADVACASSDCTVKALSNGFAGVVRLRARYRATLLQIGVTVKRFGCASREEPRPQHAETAVAC